MLSRWTVDPILVNGAPKLAVIQPRDIELFKLLHRYGILSTDYIHAFLGGHKTVWQLRLELLKRKPNAYIFCPTEQRNSYQANYRPMFYALTEKGRREIPGYDVRPFLTTGRDSLHKQFKHEALISTTLASFELGQTDTVRVVGPDELLDHAPEHVRNADYPFKLPCQISHTFEYGKRGSVKRISNKSDKPLLPDALFSLHYPKADGWRLIALEADMNTEPVERSNLQQNSWLKKLLGYRYVLGTYRDHFHVKRPMFVCAVFSDTQQMERVKKLLARLIESDATWLKFSRFFLVKSVPSVSENDRYPAPSGHMLTVPWERVGHEPLNLSQP